MTPIEPEPVAAPTYLGMVICDNILQDPETKKHYLLGTTTITYARSFPARYQKMCIYAVLTGIRERTGVTLKLVRVDAPAGEDEEMISIDGAVTAHDPLTVAELTLSMRNLRFEGPGEYRFQLWSGGTLLGERKFDVRPIGTAG